MQEKKFDCMALPKFASSLRAGFSVGTKVAVQQAGGLHIDVAGKVELVGTLGILEGLVHIGLIAAADNNAVTVDGDLSAILNVSNAVGGDLGGGNFVDGLEIVVNDPCAAVATAAIPIHNHFSLRMRTVNAGFAEHQHLLTGKGRNVLALRGKIYCCLGSDGALRKYAPKTPSAWKFFSLMGTVTPLSTAER